MMLLELPGNVVTPNSIELLFWGIPIIGIDRRAFRMLRRIQSSRTIEINSFWPKNETIHDIKQYFDDILLDDFEWMNKYFHPYDRMNALFFYPYSGMVSDGIYFEIINKFPKLKDKKLADMTYFDFIASTI